MANYFGDDANCVALWRHENGALTADSIGGNTLINSGVSADTVTYKEGAASGDYDQSVHAYQYIADADCDAGFPMKSGDTGKKISVCMWIRPDTTLTSGWDGLIGRWYALPNRCWAIHLRGQVGGPYAGWYWSSNGSAFEYKEVTTVKLTAGNWYHIATTYDDSTKAWTVTVWDDSGSTKYSNSGIGSNSIALNAAALAIGRATGDYFDGLIDEVVIFKDILSADEIDQIRTGTYGTPSPSASPSASPSPTPSASLSASPSVSPSAAPVAEMFFYPQWTWPVEETLEFHTEILRSKEAGADGSEQRIAKLIPPRQHFATQLLVRGDYANAEWEALIHYWLKREWPVPVWPEATLHTGTLAAGATTIDIDTSYADWRANGHGLIYTRDVQERLNVSNVAADQLTVDALANTFTGEKWIVPQREGFIEGYAGKRRAVTGASLIDVEFVIHDNQSVTGWSASMTYDGYDVMDEPCYVKGAFYEQTDDPEIIFIDNRTGKLDATSHTTYNRTMQPYVVHKTSKPDCWAFRQWLHAVVGRQKAFLVPTWRNDFTLMSAVGASETTVDVAHRDFALWMGVNSRRTYVFFWDRGSTLIVRKLTGMAEVDSTTERLTIDAAPGQQVATTWIAGWVDLCRLASDKPKLIWRRRGQLESNLNLERVCA